MIKSRKDKLANAYARGRLDGLQESRPFHGVAFVAFPRAEPSYLAVIQYEKAILDALPEGHLHVRSSEVEVEHAQTHADRASLRASKASQSKPRSSPLGRIQATLRRRNLARAQLDAEWDLRAARQRLTRAQTAIDALLAELEAVRTSLDAFVVAAEEYAVARPELRRDPGPQPLPASVRVYPSVEAFVEDNRTRALPDWPKRIDAGGADFGYDWTWQDPSQPWITTIWRVSYIDALREIYAIQLERRRGGPRGLREGGEAHARPVVLLASGFTVACDEWTPGTSGEWQYLTSLEASLMATRNSLVALAETLAQGNPSASDS